MCLHTLPKHMPLSRRASMNHVQGGPRTFKHLQIKGHQRSVEARSAKYHHDISRRACTAALAIAVCCSAGPSMAARDKLPPVSGDPNRCSLEALDKFAETRAIFSQEASSGMDEAFVDVRYCDYSNMDLRSKVFSGVLMRGANFENSTFVGAEFARADAKGANFMNADFTDINGYSANFDGANLENAQFENAILTGATFGKEPGTGTWANLRNAHFEGALLSSSDIGRMCENPTLEAKTKKYELGCRVSVPKQ